jgi:serine/threonine-protein kinase
MHLDNRPHAIREYLPDIPESLEQIIDKVLSKEPAARYRTADQLGRVLLRFGTQTQLDPAPELSLTPEALPAYRPELARPGHPESTHDRIYGRAGVEGRLEPEPVYHTDPVFMTAPPVDIDWVSVALGLLALIAVGGLIPFWMWVYFVYNPPIR